MLVLKSFNKFLKEEGSSEKLSIISDLDFYDLKVRKCEEITTKDHFAIVQQDQDGTKLPNGEIANTGDYILKSSDKSQIKRIGTEKDFFEKYKKDNIRWDSDEMLSGQAEKKTQEYDFSFPKQQFSVKIDDTVTEGNEQSIIVRLSKNVFIILDRDEFDKKYHIL